VVGYPRFEEESSDKSKDVVGSAVYRGRLTLVFNSSTNLSAPAPFEILGSPLGLNRTRTGISTTGEGLCRYRRRNWQ